MRPTEPTRSKTSRKAQRGARVSSSPRGQIAQGDWPWVKAIGYTLRVTQHADGTETDEVRYYICTRYLSGKRFAEAVRNHWSIESMHWVLDVNFREDDSRTRERILGNNLSWLRRFAITLLKRHPAKDSLRGKMVSCMASTAFLTEVLSLNRVRYALAVPSSSACDGVKKNGVRRLRRGPISPLRQTASARARSVLRRQTRLLGLRRAACPVFAVPGREERR